MRVIYYCDEPPESFSKSIFLAGPSPRTPDVKSWRPNALRILKAKGYDGVVYVPEPKSKNKSKFNEDDWKIKAPKWEHKMLDRSDVVLFWVPRGLVKLPGFTTNVEFGHWVNSGKAVLGHPPKAPHTGYLRFMADKFQVPKLFTLEKTIDKALAIIGDGAIRTGGEREIPLFLWNTPSFQLWYQSQKKVGNRLDGVRVYWTFKVGRNKEKVFYWAIHPNIYIASEDRNKTNESVISRFDISSVVLYKRAENNLDSEVVLVREFRSPARNDSGFVWELPGGSSPNNADPLQTIAEETFEEVGLVIDKSRFQPVISRQMAATLSAHHGNLYSVELTDEELSWLKSQEGIPHGADYPDNPTGERAYTVVVKLRDILYNNLVDWANVGMIHSVL
ncbi:MAG: nucleoside 2-deoxyribosyltransferase domain-containing protein [bacterium]|nr:nucleoside 2-deoxyribosyltransferase domain-containing protein [bacterium]